MGVSSDAGTEAAETRPEGESSDGLPARRCAYSILNDIMFKKKSLDEGYVRAEGFEELLARDRAFVRVLVSIVLKRAPEMDVALAKLLHEPLTELKPLQLINIFRLGIAQFAFLQTPAHASVNTTVELAESEGIAHHKSLVNAVMRRLTREGYDMMDPRDAGKFNTPDWLWQEWMKDYGVETALAICAANLGEAPTDFTVKSDSGTWAQKLEAMPLPSGSLRKLSGGFIPRLPGFEEGAWWVQNAAAALPAKLLGDVGGKTVIDLCAAPGGKTAQLASMGAQVTAVDRSSERVRRLAENMERLKLDVKTEIVDGSVWRPRELVDAVLVDAPCTATGTIRHQPDVLWLKQPQDQQKLAALQQRLMLNALNMLKPGGVMVYCTCSLQKAEGEHQAEWLLQQARKDGLPVQLSPISGSEMQGMAEMLTPQGELRCLPFHWQDKGGIDGFYAARFVRG
ncbi:MAG: methyltransferase domain-containing protein [Alphaproteobacteria bacterium]|nr:methyltransferase domain-containing protein [Alphaproteobacteria bacterium]